jgi:hypothetical protein
MQWLGHPAADASSRMHYLLEMREMLPTPSLVDSTKGVARLALRSNPSLSTSVPPQRFLYLKTLPRLQLASLLASARRGLCSGRHSSLTLYHAMIHCKHDTL